MNQISRKVISSAKPTEPAQAPVSDMPPIAKAGVTLAKWLLVMISIFIGLAMCGYLCEEVSINGRIASVEEQIQKLLLDKSFSAENGQLTILNEMKEQIISERKDFREFWKNTVQIILLNVLLPVLTALLGYIFGAKEGS